MTTPQPAALPELPETDYLLGFCDEGGDHLLGLSGYTADQMDARYLRGYNDALAALQSQQSTQGDTPAEAEVSDVIAMARERYRGTKWGKAAECICDAVDEAILALRPQSESDARRAAQEQLYTERERHTAEVKRLQAEIGRLQSERPQAVPMTDEQFTQLLRKLKRSREVYAY